MVCPRCLSSVRAILNDLQLTYCKIELGKVELTNEPTKKQKDQLETRLQAQGFQLLNTEESKIVNAIKSYVIDKVHHVKHHSNTNLSDDLSNLLHINYSKLSKTFSRAEGVTIEQFLLGQRIEKVKELLSYEEKTIADIAFDMGYSSTPHLSAQFKKVTGMSPTEFKKLSDRPRKSLDDI